MRCRWMLWLLCFVQVPANAAPAAWLDALPADWTLLARALCALPASASNMEGIYVSEYARFRKVLAFDLSGRYRFVSYAHGAVEDRDEGHVRVDAGFAALEPAHPTRLTPGGHLISELHDSRLLVIEDAAGRLLMNEEDLADVGEQIQWNGRLGKSDQYYRRMRCDEEPEDSAGTDGPPAPPRSALPPALRAWVFAKPVTATITEVMPGVLEAEDEVLVRIDRGGADRYRKNMPLCSAKDPIHGWVRDVDEHTSTFRVELPDPPPSDPVQFARVGTQLSTSAANCLEQIR